MNNVSVRCHRQQRHKDDITNENKRILEATWICYQCEDKMVYTQKISYANNSGNDIAIDITSHPNKQFQ